MRIGVVIPTYNEAENLPRLVSALFGLPLDLHLLVVDDNSPDGTGHLAEELSAANAGRMAGTPSTAKIGSCFSLFSGVLLFSEPKRWMRSLKSMPIFPMNLQQ